MVISEKEKLQMIEMRGRGMSIRDIAAEMQRNYKTVQRWLARYNETGEMNKAHQTGRPRKTTAADDQELHELALGNPTESVSQLLCLRQQPAVEISRTTAWRRLRESGLRVKIAKGYELELNRERVQELRVEWAEQMAREWAGWFDRTVYVDECTFSTSYSYRQNVWVPQGHRGRVSRWQRRAGRASVSVFGGIAGAQLLPLYVICGRFDAVQCADVLRELYAPIVLEMFGDGDFRFQWDNAPWHRGEAVREFCAENPRFGNSVMFQPHYSPDLNPIEHVWARIKRVVRRRVYPNKDSLSSAIVAAWESVGTETQFLSQLTSSMPRRLNAVMAAEGGPTGY